MQVASISRPSQGQCSSVQFAKPLTLQESATSQHQIITEKQLKDRKAKEPCRSGSSRNTRMLRAGEMSDIV